MHRDHCYYVYILASKPYGTLYTGVTNNVFSRTQQHKDGLLPGFTTQYRVSRLVYYEVHGDVAAAIKREKQIKRWRREWKISLIERENPQWLDLQANALAVQRIRIRLFNERARNPGTVVVAE